MTPPKKRTAEELRQALHEAQEADRAMEQTEALSDAEIAKELEDAGVDLAKIDTIAALAEEKVLGPKAAPAKADGILRAFGPQDDSTFGPRDDSRHAQPFWGRYVLYAAAGVGVLLAAGFGAVTLAHWLHEEPPSITPDNTPPGPPRPPERTVQEKYADRLRRDAFDACANKSWDACLSDLDEAKSIDPAGDTADAVKTARAAAAKAMLDALDAGEPKAMGSEGGGQRPK